MDETVVYFEAEMRSTVNPSGDNTLQIHASVICNNRKPLFYSIAEDGTKKSLFLILESTPEDTLSVVQRIFFLLKFSELFKRVV